MKTAYLSLGSNLGDRLAYLEEAVKEINNHPEIEVINISSIYQTAPYGPVPQDDYLNIAISIETGLKATELLDYTQKIELKLGRERTIHWGPRTLDIDIIHFEGVACDTERLTLPHPEAHKRRFVIEPLIEVWPNGSLDNLPLTELLNEVSDQKLKLYKDNWRPLNGQ